MRISNRTSSSLSSSGSCETVLKALAPVMVPRPPLLPKAAAYELVFEEAFEDESLLLSSEDGGDPFLSSLPDGSMRPTEGGAPLP